MKLTSLKYGFQNTQDLMGKVEREKARLLESVTRQDKLEIADAVFNFAVTAYHIKDWLINETLGPHSRNVVEECVNSQKVLCICGDICNGSKHRVFNARYKPRSNAKDIVISPLTVDMETITCDSEIPINGYTLRVQLEDGDEFEILDFANKVIEAWKMYFKRYGI